MSGFLLDTMVVSEGTKSRPNRKVAAWLGDQPSDSCYLSAFTIGEIQYGIARLTVDSSRRAELTRWLREVLLVEFRDRIVPFDLDASLVWGEIVAEAGSRGATLPTIDAQIAACARAHGLTLVTRNARHFAGTGIEVIDPWE